MARKVMITGGNGFLGVQLANRLFDKPDILSWEGECDSIDSIYLIDSRTGTASTGLARKDNETIIADLADRRTVATIVDVKPDTIFHLGSAVSAACYANPQLELMNLAATRTVMQAGSQIYDNARKVVKIIFPGSCLEYENPIEFADDYTNPNAKGPYGESKRLSTVLALGYENVDYRSIRLAAVIAGREPTSAATAYVYALANAILGDKEVAGRATKDSDTYQVIVPVPEDLRIPVMWLEDALSAFVQLHNADISTHLSGRRVINAPSISPTAGEIIAELQNYTKVDAVYQPDDDTMGVVGKATPYMEGKIAESLDVGATSLQDMIRKIAESKS